MDLGLRVANAGCRVVQLRCKGWSEHDLTSAAAALVAGFRRTGTLLIVNDKVEVARAVGAHGVNLGQGDGPLASARERLGPGVLIGRSTHDPAQVMAAQEEAGVALDLLIEMRNKMVESYRTLISMQS